MGLVLRTGLIAFAFLTLVYVCVFYYLREGQKMQLEEDWAAAGRPGDRDHWVRERLNPIADRIMRRLVLWVYFLPLAALIAVIAVTT
ncbi:MAG: hypothetical protein AAGF88_03570 [Pseudomonadota bacterium]